MVFDSARWEGFVFRPDDIVISTPPKCGTTWTQMICALLVFQTPTFDRSLDLISPWLDMLTRDIDSVRVDLDARTHRRFIKTHTPYDGLPHDPNVTYICAGRDPRDVYRSWDNHWANMDVLAMISAREQAVGLDDVMNVLAQGPPPRPELEIDRFWDWVDDDVWPELVRAATFESMREHADSIAPDTTHAIWTDNKQFFNRGCSGQWHDILDEGGVARYERRVAEVSSPDVAIWAHHGSPTA